MNKAIARTGKANGRKGKNAKKSGRLKLEDFQIIARKNVKFNIVRADCVALLRSAYQG